MCWKFDHRWATYVGNDSRDSTDAEKASPSYAVEPRYWVERQEVISRLRDRNWDRDWCFGWRGITNATNERTVIGSILPLAAYGNSLHLILFDRELMPSAVLAFSGIASSLVLDFVARQKIGGTNFNFFIPKQLPFPHPKSFDDEALNFVVPRALELSFTSYDLAAFYRDLLAENPSWDARPRSERDLPFAWDPNRRALLRAELDAFYFRFYGLTREDLRYVLDPKEVMGNDFPSESFRVLKDKEMRQFGEYRTRRLVLETWDRLFEST